LMERFFAVISLRVSLSEALKARKLALFSMLGKITESAIIHP